MGIIAYIRIDDEFRFVSAWEHNPNIELSKLHKEQLQFENVELKSRSYKYSWFNILFLFVKNNYLLISSFSTKFC